MKTRIYGLLDWLWIAVGAIALTVLIVKIWNDPEKIPYTDDEWRAAEEAFRNGEISCTGSGCRDLSKYDLEEAWIEERRKERGR